MKVPLIPSCGSKWVAPRQRVTSVAEGCLQGHYPPGEKYPTLMNSIWVCYTCWWQHGSKLWPHFLHLYVWYMGSYSVFTADTQTCAMAPWEPKRVRSELGCNTAWWSDENLRSYHSKRLAVTAVQLSESCTSLSHCVSWQCSATFHILFNRLLDAAATCFVDLCGSLISTIWSAVPCSLSSSIALILLALRQVLWWI